MTFQYCSDLHLEFRENKQYLANNPLIPFGEILLLAGDIVPFAVMNKHAAFFDFVADHFEVVYWLPGNHEYYHSDLADRCGVLNEKIRSNVFLVNNIAVHHSDVRLMFSTLWSVISPANEWVVQQGMSDFRMIKYQGRSFTAADFNEQHAACRNFLEIELGRKHENTIVVSHHLPTLLNYPERFKSDVLSEAFACELFDLVEGSGARYWIYGHHHQFIPEFSVGATKLVNNQLGYVKYGEHRMFDRKAVIALDSCAGTQSVLIKNE